MTNTDDKVREITNDLKPIKDLEVGMNQELQDFGRKKLKEGLAKCTEGQQAKFKQMYSFENRKQSIEYAVDHMPDNKIDWAMQQVEKTVLKNES